MANSRFLPANSAIRRTFNVAEAAEIAKAMGLTPNPAQLSARGTQWSPHEALRALRIRDELTIADRGYVDGYVDDSTAAESGSPVIVGGERWAYARHDQPLLEAVAPADAVLIVERVVLRAARHAYFMRFAVAHPDGTREELRPLPATSDEVVVVCGPVEISPEPADLVRFDVIPPGKAWTVLVTDTFNPDNPLVDPDDPTSLLFDPDDPRSESARVPQVSVVSAEITALEVPLTLRDALEGWLALPGEQPLCPDKAIAPLPRPPASADTEAQLHDLLAAPDPRNELPLKLDEVAVMCSVGRTTVRDWTKNNGLPLATERPLRIRLLDLVEWCQGAGRAPPDLERVERVRDELQRRLEELQRRREEAAAGAPEPRGSVIAYADLGVSTRQRRNRRSLVDPSADRNGSDGLDDVDEAQGCASSDN